MKPTRLQKKNRERIVAFLKSKVPNHRFNFGVVHEGVPKEALPNLGNEECGTIGCAIGWTPACLPRQVKFYEIDGDIVLQHKRTGLTDYGGIGGELFGIAAGQADMLFAPDLFKRNPWVAGHFCDKSSTPAEVAARLEAYFDAHP